jgi:SAM-dependent methyltransferase
VEFWEAWFRTGGLHWPSDFQQRTSGATTTPDDVAALIDAAASGPEPVRVLDVGSGPISVLGDVPARWPNATLISLDPLASVYNRLLDGAGLDRVPRVTFGLSEFPDSFVDGPVDVIHCRNALDHAFDPVRAIIQLLGMLRPGGRMVLRHFENEGAHGGYGGLHNWNFTRSDEGHFIVWCRDYGVDVSDLVAPYATLEVSLSGDERPLVTCVFEKTAHVTEAEEPWTAVAALHVAEAIAMALRGDLPAHDGDSPAGADQSAALEREAALRALSESRLRDAEAALATVMGSRSWRLTAPMRRLAALRRTRRQR